MNDQPNLVTVTDEHGNTMQTTQEAAEAGNLNTTQAPKPAYRTITIALGKPEDFQK